MLPVSLSPSHNDSHLVPLHSKHWPWKWYFEVGPPGKADYVCGAELTTTRTWVRIPLRSAHYNPCSKLKQASIIDTDILIPSLTSESSGETRVIIGGDLCVYKVVPPVSEVVVLIWPSNQSSVKDVRVWSVSVEIIPTTCSFLTSRWAGAKRNSLSYVRKTLQCCMGDLLGAITVRFVNVSAPTRFVWLN